jgi:hypothetical protein
MYIHMWRGGGQKRDVRWARLDGNRSTRYLIVVTLALPGTGSTVVVHFCLHLPHAHLLVLSDNVTSLSKERNPATNYSSGPGNGGDSFELLSDTTTTPSPWPYSLSITATRHVHVLQSPRMEDANRRLLLL